MILPTGRRTLLGVLTLSWGLLAAHVHGANLGFEEGPPGDSAPGWTFEAADSATVTAGDGPADFGVYADYGITVAPLLGAQSLRLGTPKEIDESQPRGANVALSEPVDAADGRILIAFRLFTLEHRGDDRLRFEAVDEWGAVVPGATYTFTRIGARGAGQVDLFAIASPCQAPGCELIISTGRRDKRPADTGVYQLSLGLPDGAGPVRLRYTVTGGDNEAHATWGYFDSVNRPPQPTLRMNPGGEADNPALEGDFVVADCLQSVDPDGDAVTCRWRASGGGLAEPGLAEGPIAIFWFPDDTPTARVELTVSDPAGREAGSSATVHLRNAQPAVNAVNTEVLAGGTATTVCRFADAGIGAPGVPETHVFLGTAEVSGAESEWNPSFSSGYFELVVQSSGTCTVQDKDFGAGSDPYLVRVVDPADLATRLGDESRSAAAGGNDTIEAAWPLEVDWQYLATIADPGDIDVFEIRRNGAPLPTGSEVVVSLSDLPADYDLLVFSDGGSTQASPFLNAPFVNAPFFNAPFFNAPFVNAPFVNAQFDSVPFFNAPFVNAPFVNAPFLNAPVKKSPFVNAGGDPDALFNRAFTELSLSQVGLAAPGGSHVSGSDISVAEIGSLSLRNLQSTPGISLKALSAEPGTGSEKVLVKVAPGETALYVAVVGNQLAFSATNPYALMIEASFPLSQAELLAGTGFCDGERLGSDGPLKYATTWAASGDPVPGGGSTLILTQQARFEVEQADAAAAAVAAGEATDTVAFWADFWARVDEYAASVGGAVVSVDGALFETADRNPCSVAARNALAQAIRDTYIVAPGDGPEPDRLRNPSLESVVIVGGQNVIPLFAVPDETVVGNERDFTTDLWVRPGTPLSVATAEGYNLTDAAYVDVEPTPFRGRALYLEDLPIARLVESPGIIADDLDAFLRGRPNQGRLAMGYDFFCDGTADAAAILGVEPINGPPCDAFATPWSADTLREAWLAGGDGICLAAEAPPALELALVNAHMTTYAALSALGFETGMAVPEQLPGFGDTLGATAVGACLAGSTTATIGCHSGLNVPDAWAVPGELGLPFDAARDWVEAAGNLVAPRGYGLGDNTVSTRGTEGIMTLLLEELAAGRTLGQALVTAKRRYVMSLRELDVHDEDSLVNLALFGPPQLTFDLPAPVAAASAATVTPFGELGLKLLEGNGDGTERYLVGSPTTTAVYDLLQFDDADRGTWFEVSPGAAQATYGRPLLPVTLPVEDRLVAPGDTRIHGIALVSRDLPANPCPIDGLARDCVIAARYQDQEDADDDGLFDFNPVLPLPQHDWVVHEGDGLQEPQTCVEALAPTQLGVASTLDDGIAVRQSLVVGAGQFRCEPGESRADAAGQVVGQHRLYHEVQLSALHPVGSTAQERSVRDADFDPPQVLVQTVIANPDDDSVTATLQATDALTGNSGISEIIALVYWNEADNATGSGIVESYSAKPEGALAAEPFSHTFVLHNARDQRLAFQYVDGAGNVTQKSLKGALFEAIDVSILTTLLAGNGSGTISVRVGDYCELEAPSIAVRVDDGELLVFNADDPPPGVTVTVNPSTDPDAPCDRVLVIGGLDLPADGQAVTVTVEIRALGGFGADTATIAACTDPDEPEVIDRADILACGFDVDGGDVVIDTYLAGVIGDDVQYRIDLPDLGAEFKYFQLGKTSSPAGVRLRVDVLTSTPAGSQLRFRIGNLDRLGWNGVAPLRFQQSTQSGQPGEPGQGFPDHTDVFTGVP